MRAALAELRRAPRSSARRRSRPRRWTASGATARARRGEPVELAEVRRDGARGGPAGVRAARRWSFRATVSAGTYVRALGAGPGRAAGHRSASDRAPARGDRRAAGGGRRCRSEAIGAETPLLPPLAVLRAPAAGGARCRAQVRGRAARAAPSRRGGGSRGNGGAAPASMRLIAVGDRRRRARSSPGGTGGGRDDSVPARSPERQRWSPSAPSTGCTWATGGAAGDRRAGPGRGTEERAGHLRAAPARGGESRRRRRRSSRRPAERREILAPDRTGLRRVPAVRPASWPSYSPERFVREVLIGRCGMRELVIGHDHGFGRGRSGDVEHPASAGRQRRLRGGRGGAGRARRPSGVQHPDPPRGGGGRSGHRRAAPRAAATR